MEDVRKVALLAFAVLVGGFLISFVLYFGSFLAYLRFPEWLSSHREFYRTCKSIRTGATVEEARTAMRRYLEPGRGWSPPATLPAGIFGATSRGMRESRAEDERRIVFIPDADDIADWCVVYPEKGKVVRVAVAPD
jgi:hypothetical protein